MVYLLNLKNGKIYTTCTCTHMNRLETIEENRLCENPRLLIFHSDNERSAVYKNEINLH